MSAIPQADEAQQQDKKGKWKQKMAKWESGMLRQDPVYSEQHDFDDSLLLIFPELSYLIPESDELYNIDDLEWEQVPF